MRMPLLISLSVLAYGYYLETLSQNVILSLVSGLVLIFMSNLMNGRTGFEKSGNWFTSKTAMMSTGLGGPNKATHPLALGLLGWVLLLVSIFLVS